MPKAKPASKATDATATTEGQPTVAGWKSRIVGHDRIAASQILANPLNHRRHPQRQHDIVTASLDELGIVKSVIVNRTTGRLVDGHERVELALGRSPDALVDVEYVELSEDEERKALLILDASSELATTDRDALLNLLDDLHTDSAPLLDLFSGMNGASFSDFVGRVAKEPVVGDGPGDDEPPAITKEDSLTFVIPVTVSQDEALRAAIRIAKVKHGSKLAADALTLICNQWKAGQE